MKIERHTGADFVRMPWKNGAGETLQLHIEPAHAGLDDFDWRLSSARIAQDGTFSYFAGIDRSLALLEGGPLRLQLDDVQGHGRTELELHPGQCLHDFAGEMPIRARLGADPALDLNIMTRRGRLRHRLLPFALHGAMLRSEAHWLLYLTAGQLQAGGVTLASGELLRVEMEPDTALTLTGAAQGWLVLLDAA